MEFIKVGDLCSVPFNIACGRCRNCKEGKTGICLNVNPARPGAAYGHVDMGGWIGGQAEYLMIPYADWNLLPFPDKEQAREKLTDLTMLSDIFPTGFHGVVTAGVKPGSTVYIAGAGPVGLAAAVGAQLLGAAVVIVADLVPERLAQANLRTASKHVIGRAISSSARMADLQSLSLRLRQIGEVPEDTHCASRSWRAISVQLRPCNAIQKQQNPRKTGASLLPRLDSNQEPSD